MACKPNDTNGGLRLLSFDGGVHRAASQLVVLGHLMRRVQKSGGDGGDIILPCNYFHMMGGTDTGGLIVVMLTKLQMSIDEAGEEFDRICKEVYHDQWTRETRTAKLRTCIEDLLSRRNMPIEAKMDDNSNNSSCHGFLVTRQKSNPSIITKLRTYSTRNELPLDVTIVDAILATCASEVTFLPVSVGSGLAKQDLVSGEIGACNPTREVITEAQLLFGGDASVASLVSIGAGVPSTLSLPLDGYAKALRDMLLECEETAKAIETQMGQLGFYFRFSVQQGLQLEAKADSHVILPLTTNYLEDPSTATKMDQCVLVLQSGLGLVAFDQIAGSFAVRRTSKGLPPLTANFVMRQGPWDTLTTALVESKPGQKVVVISGMGGCGKTQLIIKFAKEHKARYNHVFWIDGSSELTIKTDLIVHARAVGDVSTTSFDGAIEFFSEKTDLHWLIIYDNVDDPNLNLTSLIPSGDHGSIAITTRNRDLGQLASQVHLELDVMTRDEAIETVLRSGKLSGSESIKHALHPVIEELGRLPVALVQAGAYMFQTKCAPDEYLFLLRNNRQELLELPAPAQRDKHHRSAYAAFDLSYQQLPKQIQNFLHLISFYHHADFPLAVIPYSAKRGFNTVRFSYVENDPLFDDAVRLLGGIFYPNGVWEERTLHKILITLQNYSLCTFAPGADTLVLRTHPLLHSFCFDRIAPEKRNLYRTAAIRLLGCWDTGPRTDEQIEATIVTWGLTRHVKGFIPYISAISINDRATTAMILGTDLIYVEADSIWEGILESLLVRYGEMDLRVADAHLQLARCQFSSYETTLPALKEAVRIRSALLGPRHGDTLDARLSLSQRLLCAGQYTEAQVCLEKLEEDIPEDSSHHDDLSEELSRLYHRRGLYAKAEAIQIRQLQRVAQKHGELYIGTMGAVQLLADTYLHMGRYSESEGMFLRAQRIYDRLNMDSLNVEGRNYGLALLYTAAGRYEEAELIQKNALQQLGELDEATSHISILHLRMSQNLGIGCYYQGRYPEAEEYCFKALNEWRRRYGPNHPGVMIPSSALGLVYCAQGRHEEAEAIQLEMVERRTKFHDGMHPFVITAYSDLAATHYCQGRLDEAEKRQVWVLEQRKEWLGDNHPETAVGMYHLALTYQALNRPVEAKKLAEQVEQIQEKMIGKDHRDYKETMELIRSLEQREIARARWKVDPRQIWLALLFVVFVGTTRVIL